jgi:hypothetical protein
MIDSKHGSGHFEKMQNDITFINCEARSMIEVERHKLVREQLFSV